MPKLTFGSKESAPEGLQEFLKEEDGKFTVDVSPTAKVNEFRDNNIALSKERDTLKETVGRFTAIIGEDFEGFSKELGDLRDVNQQVKDGALKGSDAIKGEVESRVKSVREGFEGQLAEAAKALQTSEATSLTYKTRYEHGVLTQRVTSAVLDPSSGMNPQALPDILSRANDLFKVTEDGKIIPFNGEAVVYGADGASPMTPAEWLPKLLETAPYLGKSSSGGGAADGKGKVPGMTNEEFQKLPAKERLKLANRHGLT